VNTTPGARPEICVQVWKNGKDSFSGEKGEKRGGLRVASVRSGCQTKIGMSKKENGKGGGQPILQNWGNQNLQDTGWGSDWGQFGGSRSIRKVASGNQRNLEGGGEKNIRGGRGDILY